MNNNSFSNSKNIFTNPTFWIVMVILFFVFPPIFIIVLVAVFFVKKLSSNAYSSQAVDSLSKEAQEVNSKTGVYNDDLFSDKYCEKIPQPRSKTDEVKNESIEKFYDFEKYVKMAENRRNKIEVNEIFYSTSQTQKPQESPQPPEIIGNINDSMPHKNFVAKDTKEQDETIITTEINSNIIEQSYPFAKNTDLSESLQLEEMTEDDYLKPRNF